MKAQHCSGATTGPVFKDPDGVRGPCGTWSGFSHMQVIPVLFFPVFCVDFDAFVLINKVNDP